MSFNIQNFGTAGYGDLLNSAKAIWDRPSNADQRSYENIYNIIKRFKQVGYTEPTDIYDNPTLKFFKIFFHFGNVGAYTASDPLKYGDKSDHGIHSSIFSDAGLLIPTFMLQDNGKFEFDKKITSKDGSTVITHDYQYYRFNSAWAYLKNNGEEERAMMLKYFITLLSDISSNYPWYFPVIEGLDQAVNREIAGEKGFMINPERPKITIKCLQDAVDDRIGTLLDLYRAISFSWATKREILPSNLRKFNMSIYVFEAPLANVTKKLSKVQEYIPQMTDFTNYGTKFGWIAKDPTVKAPADRYVKDEDGNIVEENGVKKLKDPENDMDGELFTSYKLFEFHNCEIDYNTTKSALSTLDNQVGIQPAYELGIYFDDCYEHRLNSFHGGELGDMLLLDTATMFISSELEYAPDSSELTAAQKKAEDVLDTFTYRLKVLSDFSKGLKDKWYGFGAMADGAIKQLAQNGLPAGLLGHGTVGQKYNEIFAGKGAQWVEDVAKGAVLGNLHGLSISNIGSQLDKIKRGDIQGAVNMVNEWFGGDTKGSGYGREARDLKDKSGEAKFNLGDVGTDYKPSNSGELGNLKEDETDYKPSNSGELGGLRETETDYNPGTPHIDRSINGDKTESELIEENIRKTKIDKYNEEHKITNINSSSRNHKTEVGGYEVNLIGDNPQSKREALRGELTSYNLSDSIKNESDYREMDRLMKGSKGSLIGGTMYDDLGSQMVEKDRDLNETIIGSTDYKPTNTPRLGLGSLREKNDYNPLADNGKNIGSRTMRNENDYKAELKKRKMNNLAQSMISNI